MRLAYLPVLLLTLIDVRPAASSGLEASVDNKETVELLATGPAGLPLCLPEVTEPAEIHVITTYEGGSPLNPDAGPHGAHYVDVQVSRTENPALLLLTSYEPVVWGLNVEPGAQIAGVALSRQYPSMSNGLPKNIKVGRMA